MQRRAWLSWACVGVLALLCGLLAILQHRWIQDLSRAHKDRLQQELQSELNRLSREFNTEISNACYGLVPSAAQIDELGREKAYSLRYRQWNESHDRIFSRIALAVPEDGSLRLFNFDLDRAQFTPADWPAQWTEMRAQLLAHMNGVPPDPTASPELALIELPRFRGRGFGAGGPPHDPASAPPRFQGPDHGAPPGRPFVELEWLVLELNLDYVRSTMLPDLLLRNLGGKGQLGYQAEVVSVADPSQVVFQSHELTSQAGTPAAHITAPDAAVNLFQVDPLGVPGRDRMFRRFPGRGPPDNPRDLPARGRWRLLVRHQSGSLEAVVTRARWQNLAISAGILLLILVTGAVLVRSSRRSQQLAELQMNFVAGVSHELRTPITVIRTAAFNLQGKLATRPEQVERYGKLIQEQSDKLTAVVEQVLRFSSARAGHVIRTREPVAIESLIDEGLRSSRAAAAGPSLVIDKNIEAGLPLVLADEMALKHALQNLVDNALKYGTEGSNWIGVSLSAVSDEHGPAVELRVADRGPGIPPDELEHVFDPFFRGRRAIQDQVHGTGLGLNLVKKIVEAHGGTIRVESEPMKKTEFVVRIPAAPLEMQDEFAHSFN